MASCIIKRIIQLEHPVQCKEILIKNLRGEDITPTCMFAWSCDLCEWSPWVDLKTYNEFRTHIGNDYYLRILFAGDLGCVWVGDAETTCYNISLDNTNQFLIDFCGLPNLFQPYNNLDCALLLQQQLADTVICMLGIPIYYFKVLPDQDSADYTFKDYVLKNVSSVKQLKLMIPDGQLPSSNPQLSEFDFDWDVSWESEIGKTAFARAFGDTAFPAANDFIYVPMMKRLWKVNGAWDEKSEGLLYHSTTWKLSLVKYNENTAIDNAEFEDVVDNFIINKYADLLGTIENREQERLSGTTQLDHPTHASDNKYSIFLQDSVRATMSDNILIQDTPLFHKSTQSVRNMYVINNGEISYQNTFCGNDGTLMLVVDLTGPATGSVTIGHLKLTLQDCGEFTKVSFGDQTIELKNGYTYGVCARWSFNNFFTALDCWSHVYRGPEMINTRPQMYVWDFANMKSVRGTFNPDLKITEHTPVVLAGNHLHATNLKLYNTALSDKEMVKEAIKYTTTNKYIIINDVARPLETGIGYNVQ